MGGRDCVVVVCLVSVVEMVGWSLECCGVIFVKGGIMRICEGVELLELSVDGCL